MQRANVIDAGIDAVEERLSIFMGKIPDGMLCFEP
jgi:hypothetical protein